MRVTVLITHLNDPRVSRAIDSALAQGARVQEVLVADGGSPPDVMRKLEAAYTRQPRVRVARLPGSVARTRNDALPLVRNPIVAFLDSDEKAPDGWLERLVAPIVEGRAAFTGGPTRPLEEPRSGAERYVNREDVELYSRHVPRDLALLPMGNSAWKVETLRSIGGFDPRLGWGGEDYDVNLRALASGARGAFVPEAWVWHDQSHLRSFGKVVRRKYRYYFGAATAYLKNGSMRERARGAAKRFRVRHPIDLLDIVLKPWAYVRARLYVRRAFGRSPR